MIIALAPPLAVPAAVGASANESDAKSSAGLTSEEARRLADQFGPNSMPDTSSHPARMAMEKLWAPIPWMLEAAIVLELVLGKYIEAGIIAVLLLFNAAPAAANELEAKGFRVLAVASGPPSAMQLLGLIALSDPARDDSAALVTELKTLGVRTVMVTGDAPATAAIVAHIVGLDGAVCPPGPIPSEVRAENFAVFAGVLPEDKYKLVKAFQQAGHIVGMCGDGANDAPALRQAQMGIAVSTATDVAKSAAGIVLTNPGLAAIVASVKEGRITFQRILTYTLNSMTEKIVQVLFLGVGLIMTGHAILTAPGRGGKRIARHVPGTWISPGWHQAFGRRSARPVRWRGRENPGAFFFGGSGGGGDVQRPVAATVAA